MLEIVYSILIFTGTLFLMALGGPRWLDPAFDMLSRGKRSLVLDLKTDAGRQTALDLAARADVVIENFRPGVSARLAIHHARGELGLGEEMVIESLIGSRFEGQVIEETAFGPYRAVVPEVAGQAHITGCCEFVVDPGDELGHGFLLR